MHLSADGPEDMDAWMSAMELSHPSHLPVCTQHSMPLTAAVPLCVLQVRLAPLCFSAQYIAEMWSVDKILKVLVVINYGGLHIYRLGQSPLLLSTFDFNTLVSWQSMNDMLIINIIYAAKGEVAKRREKLRFLTRESLQVRPTSLAPGGPPSRPSLAPAASLLDCACACVRLADAQPAVQIR